LLHGQPFGRGSVAIARDACVDLVLCHLVRLWSVMGCCGLLWPSMAMVSHVGLVLRQVNVNLLLRKAACFADRTMTRKVSVGLRALETASTGRSCQCRIIAIKHGGDTLLL
jgi:hypothetical protein